MSFEGSYVEPDYTATYNTDLAGVQRVDHTLTVGTGTFNGIFYFTEKPFAPFVQAGLGWTYIDSNVSDGPPTTGCWWDPWRGYICTSHYSTYDSTDFSYGVGAGVRYDTQGSMFVKGSYTYTWVDSDAEVDLTYGQFRLELGWRL